MSKVSSAGKITKRPKATLKRKFGINKGVAHGIRKPDLKKLKKRKLLEVKRQERAQKLEEAKEKKREKELESVLERADKVLASLASPTPSLFKPAAKKSGKFKSNVAQSSPNVSYEIRDGFPVFRCVFAVCYLFRD